MSDLDWKGQDRETDRAMHMREMLATLKECERTLAGRPAFVRIWQRVRATIATADGTATASRSASTATVADMRRVILESPFAGDVARNIEYARAAVRDSVLRGEAPIASHLLFTQPGILDDNVAEERALGIAAGLAWGPAAVATVVYADLGISSGMKLGIARALDQGRPVEHRHIEGW